MTPPEWLHTYLTTNGTVDRAKLMDDADQAGYSNDQMQRAAKRLDVVYENVSTTPRRTMWSLPGREETPQQGTQPRENIPETDNAELNVLYVVKEQLEDRLIQASPGTISQIAKQLRDTVAKIEEIKAAQPSVQDKAVSWRVDMLKAARFTPNAISVVEAYPNSLGGRQLLKLALKELLTIERVEVPQDETETNAVRSFLYANGLLQPKEGNGIVDEDDAEYSSE
ncbi:hypothetical protein [Nocardia sp. NPDC051832]|uniref:hypothetical protein n=1 Tax=Nocardia sp. NPDC051832 TaxID=3155673 RepID=UPI00342739C9